MVAGFDAIAAHERELSRRFLEGIGSIPGLTLYGISDLDRLDERTPTFALRLEGFTPRAARRGARSSRHLHVGRQLLRPGGDGRLGLEESGGAVRIGFCHYNTLEEVDRVLAELRDIAGA